MIKKGRKYTISKMRKQKLCESRPQTRQIAAIFVQHFANGAHEDIRALFIVFLKYFQLNYAKSK
jgi:hypothetical protein